MKHEPGRKLQPAAFAARLIDLVGRVEGNPVDGSRMDALVAVAYELFKDLDPLIPRDPTVRGAPTRRDLLLVIGQLQDMLAALGTAYTNDASSGTAVLQGSTVSVRDLHQRGFDLCVKALGFDPPTEGTWPPT
jgi:hypothetical protein